MHPGWVRLSEVGQADGQERGVRRSRKRGGEFGPGIVGRIARVVDQRAEVSRGAGNTDLERFGTGAERCVLCGPKTQVVFGAAHDVDRQVERELVVAKAGVFRQANMPIALDRIEAEAPTECHDVELARTVYSEAGHAIDCVVEHGIVHVVDVGGGVVALEAAIDDDVDARVC